jgi:glycosyltransferase involved in cell wall biosynthesis
LSRVVNHISLVVPCYNEIEVIDEFFGRAAAVAETLRPRTCEFIFVNDGSTDGTGNKLNALAHRDERVKVLHLARNCGHQIALTAGMDHASGDMIITMDADLQDPPELAAEMLRHIEAGYDIVHTQRLTRAGETRFKLLTARCFYWVLRHTSADDVAENTGDFRAFTKAVLLTVLHFRGPHRYLRGTFAQLGFPQITLSYDRAARYAGHTKYSLFKMLHLAQDALVNHSDLPLQMIVYVAILLWCLSLGYLAKALWDHFVTHSTVKGWTSLIVLQTMFTGIILACLAVMSAYLRRIFEHGRNAPLYWLRDARNLDPLNTPGYRNAVKEVLLSERILATYSESSVRPRQVFGPTGKSSTTEPPDTEKRCKS